MSASEACFVFLETGLHLTASATTQSPETHGEKAAFAAISRALVVSDFRSLRGDIVFEALSARQSPAAKIPFLAAGWRDPFASATGRPVSLNGLTLGPCS
jgi:hypothetical protein